MKNYFKSLFAECPRYRMVIWWVFRALMIYAFIKGFRGRILHFNLFHSDDCDHDAGGDFGCFGD